MNRDGQDGHGERFEVRSPGIDAALQAGSVRRLAPLLNGARGLGPQACTIDDSSGAETTLKWFEDRPNGRSLVPEPKEPDPKLYPEIQLLRKGAWSQGVAICVYREYE